MLTFHFHTVRISKHTYFILRPWTFLNITLPSRSICPQKIPHWIGTGWTLISGQS